MFGNWTWKDAGAVAIFAVIDLIVFAGVLLAMATRIGLVVWN